MIDEQLKKEGRLLLWYSYLPCLQACLWFGLLTDAGCSLEASTPPSASAEVSAQCNDHSVPECNSICPRISLRSVRQFGLLWPTMLALLAVIRINVHQEGKDLRAARIVLTGTSPCHA